MMDKKNFPKKRKAYIASMRAIMGICVTVTCFVSYYLCSRVRHP